jgi:gamma-glutamyltranspeptidase/glutathione hydrolase
MRDLELPGRSAVHASQGMVSTSHPLASLTAVNTLMAGGNAMDAAIAAMAVLGVVEPYNVGVGGDCFALYAPGGRDGILAYNGSGRAPAAESAERIRASGLDAIPPTSAHAVTIPGAVDAWVRLAEDHGRKGIDALLRPAIHYAEHGYPVFEVAAFYWRGAVDKLRRDPNSRRLFLIDDAAPLPGAMHRQPLLAETLRRIARDGRDGFYTGPVAEDIVRHLRAAGGAHDPADFAAARGEYVTPIRTRYRGFDVFECPPNGQGIVALMMLNILGGFSLCDLDPRGATRLHLEVEASRLAYRDRDRLIGDPAQSPVPTDDLLSTAYADGLRAAIDPSRALPQSLPSPFPTHAETSHVCVVDGDRNAVSLIGSIFQAFGSGLTAPGSGVVLQNRGHGFSLDPQHPNVIAPGKRPLHTIIPAIVCRDGRVSHALGVVGGHYQPCGHVHLLSNMIDFGLDPQAAVDLGRVFHDGDVLEVEQGIDDRAMAELAALGHRVRRRRDNPAGYEGALGTAQLIAVDWNEGVLTGAADHRADGCALGY